MPAGLSSMRMAVDAEVAFPRKVMVLSVEAATDFERRGQGDDQLRDPATGHRIWNVRCFDPNPDASTFGRVAAVTVKIAAPQQPVPPPSQFPEVPPMVSFTGMTVTPYLNRDKCKPAEPGKPHKCRAQLAYSIWATAMVDALDPASA